MGFLRQEYLNGLAFPSLGDLPNPGIKPVSLMSPALVGGFFFSLPLVPPGKPYPSIGSLTVSTVMALVSIYKQ